MSDVHIRIQGRAGRITLSRPDALNALTHRMCLDIEATITRWAADPNVHLVILDAEGRSFCAGGDLAEMYRTGAEGDLAYGRRFWTDEYRLNAKLFRYPKPIAAFLQGYTMGGGVGLGCHASHRIVGETSRIAMPETGVGLVPDVGGSMLLANAPGRLGEYLAVTAERMGAADAIYAGFADTYMLEEMWPDRIAEMAETGRTDALEGDTPGPAPLAARQAEIDGLFAGETLGDILRLLDRTETPLATEARTRMAQHSPLAMGAAIETIHRLRGTKDITQALEMEYRFAFRAMEDGDFLEGIRALIVDKDHAPRWRHALDTLRPGEVSAMLRPLGADRLDLEDPA
ncbi:MAG: enoyl-CoA hydratase/isomerase family protein [Shimia sp.]